MNTNDQKIFDRGRWNACLDKHLDFIQFARYYLECANELIERSVEDSSKLDVYIYSVVFLYRHSVELLLKELIWMSNYLLGRGKTFPKKHDLTELWRALKNNATSLLTSDFPLNEEEVQYVEAILEEIMRHDPKSYAFRYPFDKKMKRTHSDVNHINVKSLYERLNQIHEYLGRISYMIDLLYKA